MSVSVRIPTILRTYTDGAGEVTVEPAEDTLVGVLDALEAAAPGIRARVLDDAGALRRFVNVYVDDEDVRFTGALDTAVKDGDRRRRLSADPGLARESSSAGPRNGERPVTSWVTGRCAVPSAGSGHSGIGSLSGST
jgi:molybdopterin synthase sulfur carrier subunit